MRRREFVFGSLPAALLLDPVLSIRRAEAQTLPPKRCFIWVNCCGYPRAEDFFPTGGERDFKLSPILADFATLRSEMVIVDGINIRNSGLNPKGNNHVRTVGKVLTAKDVLRAADSQDGLHGGPSIDHIMAKQLGAPSLELQVSDRFRVHMRNRPFASGPKAAKPGLVNPAQAWEKVFKGFSASDNAEMKAARQRYLTTKKSLLDTLTVDLKRFRQELVGVEKLKLDIHEDAIVRAEQSVRRDIETANDDAGTACQHIPEPSADNLIPVRAQAHLDLALATLSCNRARIVGLHWGHSGYHWKYQWAGVKNVKDSGHDEVHHRASARRPDYTKMAQWDWGQLRSFVERLKGIPEGSGTMLDNTVILAISHFGNHHQMARIPVVLFGNAQGALRTGRYLKLSKPRDNDRVLTSVARLMGVDIPGIGDDPTCGPLAELG